MYIHLINFVKHFIKIVRKYAHQLMLPLPIIILALYTPQKLIESYGSTQGPGLHLARYVYNGVRRKRRREDARMCTLQINGRCCHCGGRKPPAVIIDCARRACFEAISPARKLRTHITARTRLSSSVRMYVNCVVLQIK